MANQAAYGFTTLKDLFNRRVTEVGVEVVSAAIQRTVDEHNRQMRALIGLFVRETTEFKTRFRTPTIARLQPIDESGRARPIRISGYYDVAFPIQMAGAALGTTFLAREKQTVGEVNEDTISLISADARWMRDHILAALFTNVSWTFTDEDHGALTILGLANADAQEYLIQSGADAGATDTHYLAQSAAIADATNPFGTIHAELTEHPENAGEVICFVPTANKAAVEGLTNFIPISDPNVREGANTAQLTGDLGVTVPGILFGYETSKVWLAEWKTLPDNYLIAVTTGGERPVSMREEPEATLRGFRRIADRPDHPYYEGQWIRRMGMGAWNRVGAVVQRVGNASYAIPTNYGSPMP